MVWLVHRSCFRRLMVRHRHHHNFLPPRVTVYVHILGYIGARAMMTKPPYLRCFQAVWSSPLVPYHAAAQSQHHGTNKVYRRTAGRRWRAVDQSCQSPIHQRVGGWNDRSRSTEKVLGTRPSFSRFFRYALGWNCDSCQISRRPDPGVSVPGAGYVDGKHLL